MPLQVNCPHCASPCLVAEQHLGSTVRCGKCRNTFTAKAPETSDSLDDFLPTFELPSPAPAAPPKPAGRLPRLDIGAVTSVGKVRDRNEDSFLIHHLRWANLDKRHDVALVVVADGMGGYQAGDRASDIVIRTVGNSLTSLLTGAMTSQLTEAAASAVADAIGEAIRDANQAVLKESQANKAAKGMGATGAIAVIWDDNAMIGHVGDCRVYHLSEKKIFQVTEDQTLVARMVATGTLTAEAAKKHPMRNEVAQAFGRHPQIEPGQYHVKLAVGDWLIVACDGLHTHVETPELEAEINRATPSAAALAERLVDLANQRGGSDNCTVIAVRCY